MIIYGDLLDFKCDVIVQQCNCLTVKSHGLSKSISDKWPEADIYSKRNKQTPNLAIKQDRGTPGTCLIIPLTNTSKCKYVASILGQWKPGKIYSVYNYPKFVLPETSIQRELWFKQGLLDLETQLNDLNIQSISIAFPYRIGCGLAGGNWINYLKMIEDFTKRNTFTVNILNNTI